MMIHWMSLVFMASEECGERLQPVYLHKQQLMTLVQTGFFFGNTTLFLIQGLYLIVCIAYAAAMTWMLFLLVDSLFGMRVTKDDEMVGLDLAQHHEAAYTVLE